MVLDTITRLLNYHAGLAHTLLHLHIHTHYISWDHTELCVPLVHILPLVLGDTNFSNI